MTRVANLWRLPKASAGFAIFGDQSSISGFFFGNAVSWASPTAFLFPRLLEPRARHFGAVDEQPGSNVFSIISPNQNLESTFSSHHLATPSHGDTTDQSTPHAIDGISRTHTTETITKTDATDASNTTPSFRSGGNQPFLWREPVRCAQERMKAIRANPLEAANAIRRASPYNARTANSVSSGSSLRAKIDFRSFSTS